MALTVQTILKTKPRAAAYKLADEKGLFLLVQPSGSLLWRLKFRVNGRDACGKPKRIEKKLSLGAFPEVTLKEARELRDRARAQLAKGVDPAVAKQSQRNSAKLNAVNTFDAVATGFIGKSSRDGLSEATVAKRKWLLKLVAKSLGRRPMADITPVEILAAVRPFEEARNAEKACRALQFVGQVFRYAVACQLVPSDPTRDLRGALTSPRVKHHAAIVDEIGVGSLLRAIEGYEGQPLTQLALRLLPLVFVRPGELRQAEWSEVSFETAVWRIPSSKMKGRRAEHAVPLSRQTVEIFHRAKDLSGDGRYVFPCLRTHSRPMSENTICAALRRLGFSKDEMTAHGFRSTACTLLNESGRWSVDAIERSLSHQEANRIRGAYHHGAHWAERVKMAQWWADYLDSLRTRGCAGHLEAAA